MDRSEYDDTVSKFEELGPAIISNMAADFDAEATEEAPIRHGGLRGSIQAGIRQLDDFNWMVGSNLEYAPPVHDGHLTRPAIKHPERSKGQHWVEGNPFFDRAGETVSGRLDEYEEMAKEDVGLD